MIDIVLIFSVGILSGIAGIHVREIRDLHRKITNLEERLRDL